MLCRWCTKTFTTKEGLIRHIKNRHNHRKPYDCRECRERFRTISDFRVHLPLHLNALCYIWNKDKIIDEETIPQLNEQRWEIKINDSNNEIPFQKNSYFDDGGSSTEYFDESSADKYSNVEETVTSSSFEQPKVEETIPNDEETAGIEEPIIELPADETVVEKTMPIDVICQVCQCHCFSMFDLGYHILNEHANQPCGDGERCYGCYHYFKGGLPLLQHMKQCEFINCVDSKKRRRR